MCFEYIHRKQGACGRYKDKQNVSTLTFIVFDNMGLENGACGRYNNKQKSVNS